MRSGPIPTALRVASAALLVVLQGRSDAHAAPGSALPPSRGQAGEVAPGELDPAQSGPAAEPADADAAELWAAGERAAALALWEAELAARPGALDLRLELAERSLLAQRYRAALRCLAPLPEDAGETGSSAAEAATLPPELGARVRRLRGHAHYFLGEYEAALARLDAAAPSDVLLRAAALESLGRMDAWAAAVDAVEAALGADDPRACVLRARALAEAGELEAAIERFRAALGVDPVNAAALFGLGRALLAAGERDEGLAVLARHRELLPLLDALDFVRRGLDLAPAHAPQHAALADLLRELGRLAEAERAYARAWELAQGREVVPIALRVARFLAEDRGAPLAGARLADRAHERVADVRLLVRAGDLYRAAGEREAAAARYRAALAARPDDRALRARLAAVTGEDGADARGEEPR